MIDGKLTREEELLLDQKSVEKAKEYKRWRDAVHDANEKQKKVPHKKTKQSRISSFFSVKK